MPTIGVLPLSHVRQRKHPPSLWCWHRALTEPTVDYLCYLQKTTTHRTALLTSPFFGGHLHVSRHLSIFFMDIGREAIAQKPEWHGQFQPMKCVPIAIGQSIPVLLGQSLF